MNLKDLNEFDGNPRKIADAALTGLKESISRFGLVEPIVWNKRTGNIVGGHQRRKILIERGESETDVVVVDLPEAEEIALNITLNNSEIEGDWDTSHLVPLLDSMDNALMDSLNINDLEDELLKHLPQEDESKFEEYICPCCNNIQKVKK